MEQSPDLNELAIFTRVVQAGSFTAAARLLLMPKSSVSRKVLALEDRLGARLLHRTTRKLGLTDAGRVYYQHSARIVAEVEEAGQAIGQLQAAPRGLLRVTAPLSFGMLSPIAAEFLRRFPDVQLEVLCTDRRVDLIAERFDLAIRAGALGDSTQIARKLGALTRVLVASPAYLRRRGRPRLPAELRQHDCISFGAGPIPSVWTLRSGGRSAEIRIEPRLAVNDFDWMLEAARAGLGIAWMPRFVCAKDLRAGRLEPLLSAWCSTETPVHALYPTARHLSPKIVAFCDLVRKRLKLR